MDCGRRPHLPRICAQSDPPLQKTPYVLFFGILKYVCDIVVKKFTFTISSPDEFLFFWVEELGPTVNNQ